MVLLLTLLTVAFTEISSKEFFVAIVRGSRQWYNNKSLLHLMTDVQVMVKCAGMSCHRHANTRDVTVCMYDFFLVFILS